MPTIYSQIASTQKAQLFHESLNKAKGHDIAKVELFNNLTDIALIVTATSARHAQGLADAVLATCKEENIEFLSMEGFELGEWILIDCNDVLVHVLQEDKRALYSLEGLLAALRPSKPLVIEPQVQGSEL